MSSAFIICTRVDSERLPNKPFRKINGVPVLELLIRRLQKCKLPIFIAYPVEQDSSYRYLAQFDNVWLHPSTHANDPLKRMYECADHNKVDTIIRVSHDKIFVDSKDVAAALHDFHTMGLEYLYGSKFTPGTGFEIIGFKALERAQEKFKNVEYIGYSVRAVTDKIYNFNPRHHVGNYRFLIDYESDMKLLDVVLSQLGNDCELSQVFNYIDNNPELKQINANPILTIYTCAHNGAEWLQDAMDSVAMQTGFKSFEYIIIDDHSKDETTELVAKFALKNKNVSWLRNDKNMGLASSSNLALKKARGKYIVRLDADDFFKSPHALNSLIREIEEVGSEVVYPDNYFGDYNTIQKGNEKHHIGGAIFDKAALTHLKFTEGLTDHDSLDVFLRAKEQLKISYYEQPIFFYRQHGKSMSKTNLERRAKIEKKMRTERHYVNQDFDEHEAYFEGPDEVRKYLS